MSGSGKIFPVILLVLAVALFPEIHGAFLKAYRQGDPPTSSRSYRKDQLGIHEENLERWKIVEEKRSKKFYFAVREPLDQEEEEDFVTRKYTDYDLGTHSREMDEELEEYGHDLNLDTVTRKYSYADVDSSGLSKYQDSDLGRVKVPRRFKIVPRSSSAMKVKLDSEATLPKYETDFSDLTQPPAEFSTTVEPESYLIIGPDELSRDHHISEVRDDFQEQATQLYQMSRKSPKTSGIRGFKPSAFLEYLNDDDTQSVAYSAPKSKSGKNYKGHSGSSNPIFHDAAHEISGEKKYSSETAADQTRSSNARTNPIYQNNVYTSDSSYETKVKIPADSTYGSSGSQPTPVFQNSVHTSSPVSDYLQLQLLEALQDNKALLKQQQQQRLVPISTTPISNYASQHQQMRWAVQPAGVLSGATAVPARVHNNFAFNNLYRRFPHLFKRRSDRTTSQHQESPNKGQGKKSESPWRPLVDPLMKRRVRRSSLFSTSAKQLFPISFSIPILPHATSVPQYAILDTELVHVGDFNDTSEVIDKLPLDFPPLQPGWTHISSLLSPIAEHVSTTETSAYTPEPPANLGKETMTEGSGKIENSGDILQPGKQNLVIPELIKPFTNEVEGRGFGSTAPADVFKHDIDPSGSYNVRFSSHRGIDFKESGFSRLAESEVGSELPEGTMANVKIGSVAWTSPEGFTFILSYEADEKGYRPKLTKIIPPSSVSLSNSAAQSDEVRDFDGGSSGSETEENKNSSSHVPISPASPAA